MLIIAIAFVVFIIFSVIAVFLSYDLEEASFPIVMIFIGCVFFCVIFMGTYSVSSPKVVDYHEDTNLRALSTSSEISGSFFLASGTVDEEPVYKYISIREDGGFEFDSVKVSKVVVYEIDGDKAFLRETHYKQKSNLWTIFDPPSETSFHVPVGSVQEAEYSISTQ